MTDRDVPWVGQVNAPTHGPGACASEAQLDRVAEEYAAIMRSRGHTIGPAEMQAIRRMASIQDAWRAAFYRVLW